MASSFSPAGCAVWFVRFCLTIAMVAVLVDLPGEALALLLERLGQRSVGGVVQILATVTTIWAVTPRLLELTGRTRVALSLLGLGMVYGAAVYGLVAVVRLEQMRRRDDSPRRYSGY
jgi:hypothetical protein